MTSKYLIFLILFTIYCSLFTDPCLAQDQKVIDSLHHEIKKVDDHKIELGTKAKPLMDSAKANILYEILIAYYGTVPDSANKYAEELKSLSEQIGYKKGIGNYYNGIGLTNMVKGRNFVLAEESFQMALKIRTEIGDKEGIGWTYNNMGNMYGIEGNLLEAIKCHGKALNVWEEIRDKERMTESLTKRAREFVKMGNYPDGLKDALYALKLSNELGNKVNTTVVLDGIGRIYELEGNYSEALKNYSAEAAIYEQIGNVSGITNSNQIFGKVYLLKRDTLEALKRYNEAIKLCAVDSNGYMNLQLHLDVGNIYFYQGKYDEALKDFFVALRISNGLKEKNGISTVSIAIAMAYNKQGKYQEALRFINNVLEDGRQRGEKNEMKDAYQTLSEIYANLHDYKAAYTNQILYQQMKDTLFNIGNTSKMKQLDMQYEFDKDAAIQKAVQDKKDGLLEKEVETQRFRRDTIFLISGIVVVFLIVVIILRNRIAKERRQKALEFERNRISRDLHDDLGSGLTKITLMSQAEGVISEDYRKNALHKINLESSDMVDQMNSIIWALNIQNDSLPNLIIFIKKNAFGMYEDAPIKLIWNAPEKIPERYMNGEIRKNIYLVMKEALHNALKYSKATEVAVKIDLINDKLNFIIEDNGQGFDVVGMTGKGNGLLNMKRRIEDINGSINISSEMNAGTRISFSCKIE
jgi:two-component system sensor histidine kinase UhpB